MTNEDLKDLKLRISKLDINEKKMRDLYMYKEVVYFLAMPKEPFSIEAEESEIANVLWVDKDKVRNTLTYENLREIWDQALIDI